MKKMEKKKKESPVLKDDQVQAQFITFRAAMVDQTGQQLHHVLHVGSAKPRHVAPPKYQSLYTKRDVTLSELYKIN